MMMSNNCNKKPKVESESQSVISKENDDHFSGELSHKKLARAKEHNLQQNNNVLENLPGDLLLEVLSFCDVKDLIQCRGLCSPFFQRLSTDSSIWRNTTVDFRTFTPSVGMSVEDYDKKLKKWLSPLIESNSVIMCVAQPKNVISVVATSDQDAFDSFFLSIPTTTQFSYFFQFSYFYECFWNNFAIPTRMIKRLTIDLCWLHPRTCSFLPDKCPHLTSLELGNSKFAIQNDTTGFVTKETDPVLHELIENRSIQAYFELSLVMRQFHHLESFADRGLVAHRRFKFRHLPTLSIASVNRCPNLQHLSLMNFTRCRMAYKICNTELEMCIPMPNLKRVELAFSEPVKISQYPALIRLFPAAQSVVFEDFAVGFDDSKQPTEHSVVIRNVTSALEYFYLEQHCAKDVSAYSSSIVHWYNNLETYEERRTDFNTAPLIHTPFIHIPVATKWTKLRHLSVSSISELSNLRLLTFPFFCQLRKMVSIERIYLDLCFSSISSVDDPLFWDDCRSVTELFSILHTFPKLTDLTLKMGCISSDEVVLPLLTLLANQKAYFATVTNLEWTQILFGREDSSESELGQFYEFARLVVQCFPNLKSLHCDLPDTIVYQKVFGTEGEDQKEEETQPQWSFTDFQNFAQGTLKLFDSLKQLTEIKFAGPNISFSCERSGAGSWNDICWIGLTD